MIEQIKQKLTQEVEQLNHELNVVLPEALKKALQQGDLRENGDYHAALERQKLGAKMVLQVHDELVFEIPEHERTDAGALVKREMEGVASLVVPLVVSIGAGKNWVDAKG